MCPPANDFEDDLLIAYADGELSGEEAAAIRAAAEKDPELAAKIARFQSHKQILSAAFPEIKAPLPTGLAILLGDGESKTPTESGATVIAFKPRPKPPVQPANSNGLWAQWGGWAIAACLAAAIVTTMIMFPVAGPATGYRQATGPASAQTGATVDKDLADALAAAWIDGAAGYTETLADGRKLTMGDKLDVAGHDCRSFTLTGAAAKAGLICQDGKGWQTMLLSKN